MIRFGLRNTSTDCYMNAVLQCLFAQQEFVDYIQKYSSTITSYPLQKIEDPKNIKRDRKNEIISIYLLQALATVINRMNEAQKYQDDKTVTIDMSNFRRIVYNTFGDGHTYFLGQNDSYEFLTKLLEYLHQGFIKVGLILRSEYCETTKSTKYYTIINNIFGGSEYSQIKSTTCTHENSKSIVESEYYTLSVPINMDQYIQNPLPDGSDISQYLNQNFAKDYLEGDNRWHCEECSDIYRAKILRDAEITRGIHHFPKILMVVLKRFDNDGIKLKKKVRINRKIEVNSDTDDKTFNYELCGIVYHLGTRILSGHYISLVRREDDRWYLYNDENVSRQKAMEDDDADIITQDGYIIFYRLRECD